MTTLGGGPFNGYSTIQTITNYKGSEQTHARSVLRKGLNMVNTNKTTQGTSTTYGRVTTPFRAFNNSGDLLGRVHYSCGGPNPTSVSKPGYARNIGSMFNNCDNTGVPAASCNVKWVADSSDYVKFKKLSAINKNYNDLGYGGDQSNGSYSALMRVRHS